MSPQSNPWADVLSELVTKVDGQTFETWFRPVAFRGCDETVLRLAVPNDNFRRWLSEGYGELLRETATAVLGAPHDVCISVEASEPIKAAPAAMLPVLQAAALERASPGCNWLIERLWTAGAVGILGAPPKIGKSWMAMDMAVSVASGVPCLGTFSVPNPGPVLLYAAEDSTPAVRSRLESLTAHYGVDLQQLKLWVITADFLRLDRSDDQQKLEATVASYRPRLLVLDPLIRLHMQDENASGPMAALLGYFRALQRRTGTAIAIVHHSRKGPVSGGAGYSLRGSSELYAFVDCFLHLQRRRGQLTLTAEHRSAPSFGPVALALAEQDGAGTHLEIVSGDATTPGPTSAAHDGSSALAPRLLNVLSTSSTPLTVADLRRRLQVRNQRLVEVLHQLSSQGKVQRTSGGYLLQLGPPG